jgi:Fe-S-cluster containining protein
MLDPAHDPAFRSISHPRFRFVEIDIFTRTLVADCMAHACVNVQPHRPQLDACCQYGADVDLGERDAILAHADELRRLLRPEAAAAPWFTDKVELDPDYPSGKHVRTAVHGDGCIFLAHDQRGCAIHRASLEGGWDFHGVKPNICRLFPLTYDSDSILISDDYRDYSCAFVPGAPSLYRVQRATLGAIFGPALLTALDAVEATLDLPRRAGAAGLRVLG